MNYKPDEGTLISYVYGELDAQEAEKVSVYLNAHPEEKAKLQLLADTKDMMGYVRDKEVIAPPIFLGDDKVKPFWQYTYFKTVMSIAASFLLLMVAGRLLGTEINYGGGELRISFGGKRTQPPIEIKQPQNSLTEEKVKAMIDASLSANNETLASNWTEDQKKLNQSIRVNLDQNSKKIDNLMKDAASASQEQVKGFVASLQNENLKLMKDYFQLSSSDQKKYMEGLLVDFSKYLTEQRKQDVMMIQTRMSSIEKNTDQFKQETEQILASIISNPESSRSKNNY